MLLRGLTPTTRAWVPPMGPMVGINPLVVTPPLLRGLVCVVTPVVRD